MSLVKAVPNGLKDCKCKVIALHKRPLIPYISKKDYVKETVFFFKDNHLRTQIGKGAELWVPLWHSGTHEAFLIHVGSALEAYTKKGYWKAYKEFKNAYLRNLAMANG